MYIAYLIAHPRPMYIAYPISHSYIVWSIVSKTYDKINMTCFNLHHMPIQHSTHITPRSDGSLIRLYGSRGLTLWQNKRKKTKKRKTKRLTGAWITHLVNCWTFKGNNFKKKHSDNFDSMRTLVGLVIRFISSIKRFILFIIVFKILVENG